MSTSSDLAKSLQFNSESVPREVAVAAAAALNEEDFNLPSGGSQLTFSYNGEEATDATSDQEEVSPQVAHLFTVLPPAPPVAQPPVATLASPPRRGGPPVPWQAPPAQVQPMEGVERAPGGSTTTAPLRRQGRASARPGSPRRQGSPSPRRRDRSSSQTRMEHPRGSHSHQGYRPIQQIRGRRPREPPTNSRPTRAFDSRNWSPRGPTYVSRGQQAYAAALPPQEVRLNRQLRDQLLREQERITTLQDRLREEQDLRKRLEQELEQERSAKERAERVIIDLKESRNRANLRSQQAHQATLAMATQGHEIMAMKAKADVMREMAAAQRELGQVGPAAPEASGATPSTIHR